MTRPGPSSSRIDDLLGAFLQQTLTDAESTELAALLAADANARLVYLCALDQEVNLRRLLHPTSGVSDGHDDLWLKRFTAELDLDRATDEPRHAPSLDDNYVGPALTDLPDPGPPSLRLHPAPRPLAARTRRISPTYWVVGAIAAGLVLAVGTFAFWPRPRLSPLAVTPPQVTPATSPAPLTPNPAPPTLATLTATSSPRWVGSALTAGACLSAGSALSIDAGVVELTFTPSQAKVIIEGPARAIVESATVLRLDSGRLAASVPHGGFTVRTAAMVVTDLGTEFGVVTAVDGGARVEVFKGRVQAQPVAPDGQIGSPDVLVEGEAATASSNGVVRDANGALPQNFVRGLRTTARSLDLVDLLAGGDGTTARRGWGIDNTTGRAGPLNQVGDLNGNHQYLAVPNLPVVDGCFIPDGKAGPVRIDSVGHTFAFEPTSNTTHGLLWAGGPIPAPPKQRKSQPPPLPVSPRLGNTDYSQPGHGLLVLHSNKGVTIDLDRVRRLHPDNPVLALDFQLGNSFVPPKDAPRSHPVRANFYVVVDGAERFQSLEMLSGTGAVPVHVPLNPGDRFLTLASTEGHDTIANDWVLCGDPTFDLRPATASGTVPPSR